MELPNLVSSPGSREPFHTVEPLRRTTVNRLFAALYVTALTALFYRHIKTLVFQSKTVASLSISVSLLISDFILAFMWVSAQAFRLKMVRRKEFPDKLRRALKEESFPALDVFICTADPYKEPPASVVNTALSLMAYDYPTEKLSVYISDDGGSALTLFAFLEAAKFARHWLPFCRENHVMKRSPDEFFSSSDHASWSSEATRIKMMYEDMKAKIEKVMDKGKVGDEYITTHQEREAFKMWEDTRFTRQDHPTVIQIILKKSEDKDVTGHPMPNLIYVAREKSKTAPHHFKAGALNVLIRVSAVMTNAPLILTQDCDMYSNDPGTPLRVLCYISDPSLQPKVAYVQFPQRFHGTDRDDIYGNRYILEFQISLMGFDGILGPGYIGTGCFFRRRALFGSPLHLVQPEILELRPDHVVDKPIQSEGILALAHQVANCNYENKTSWGYEIGMRYGSMVEDFYTGFRLQCQGWKSLCCNPDRAAFLGSVPITLLDNLTQSKRWSIGLLDVAFSRYNPLVYSASRSMHIFMVLGYAHYSHWAIWFIPIATYAFLPQLALLNGISIFPKISERWFVLYIFLFLSAYAKDLLDFVLAHGTVQQWWNSKRIWLIRGITSFLFGTTEYLLMFLGFRTQGFSLTSKVLQDEQRKRYEQGVFEFGVASPMFVPLIMAAIINLISLILGTVRAFLGKNMEGLWLQMLLAGFGVINCRPIYEAIALRSDTGKIATKTIFIAVFLVGMLCTVGFMIL